MVHGTRFAVSGKKENWRFQHTSHRIPHTFKLVWQKQFFRGFRKGNSMDF